MTNRWITSSRSLGQCAAGLEALDTHHIAHADPNLIGPPAGDLHDVTTDSVDAAGLQVVWYSLCDDPNHPMWRGTDAMRHEDHVERDEGVLHPKRQSIGALKDEEHAGAWL